MSSKKKIKIGIDLNNVLRPYNEAAIRFYEKCYDVKFDLTDEEAKDVNLDEVLKFKSKIEKNHFFYENYPLEIHGFPFGMEMMLVPHLNEWLKKMEDDGNEVWMVSFDEHILSIPATLFFLSKLGIKSRYTILPHEVSELNGKLDTLITANPKALKYNDREFGIIGVERGYNKDCILKADKKVSSLEDVFKLKEDELFFKKGVKKKKNFFQKLFNIK